ncbi:hypothetical protein CBL_00471 [Carabus blaptoides fortunei]
MDDVSRLVIIVDFCDESCSECIIMQLGRIGRLISSLTGKGTDQVTMFVWDESVASRGPEEVGSGILYYIKLYVKTTKLIMYSDQCDGQNSNIKLPVLCQYTVSHPDYVVNEIDHKFLVSGHSYLLCDQEFGLVEKQKKIFKDIFAPDNWIDIIKAARKTEFFITVKMKAENFISTKKLECNIVNRKNLMMA